MSILLALWIILGLFAMSLIASVLPFSLHVKGARKSDFSYQVSFQWPWRAFGVGVRRSADGRYFQLLWGNRCLYERKRRKKTSEKKTREKKEKKPGGFNLFRDRKLLSQLIRAGLRFFRDLLSCFRRRRLAGNIEVGIGDPAAMGILSGLVYAVSPNGMALDDLRITPNYMDATFTGEVDFSTAVQPARVIIVFIKSIFYLPIRELLRLFRRTKRAAKKKEVN